jgi:hypothetical protein
VAEQAAGAPVAAKQKSHRPRHAPALGLRAAANGFLADRPSKGMSVMWPTLFSLRLALSKLTPRKGRSRRPAIRRPSLEALEDRAVPSGASLASYGQLPLSFELNRGQTAAPVNYLARGSGYTLFLSPTQATLGLTPPSAHKGASSAGDVLRLGLVGANPAAPAVGLDRLPGVSNYFIGNDPSKWLTNVPNYGEVEYQNVYPGVNLVYYGNQGQLEYDFVLAPGADPGAIRLAVQGAQGARLDAQGNLVLHTAGGDVVQHAPVVYQDVGGKRQSVAGRFVLEGNGQVGFQVGAYDRAAPLVIDPVLVYSTYLGGSGNDFSTSITVDSAGNAYITGGTSSLNFPTTPGAVQTSYSGSSAYSDVFISKLNASGTALVYSTYLGGSSYGGHGAAIAVDASGDAYITGQAAGSNFPTTPGAFQQQSSVNGPFVTELSPTGSALVYSTYLTGSSGADEGLGIAVTAAGNAYITGYAVSTDFPTTPNSFDPVFHWSVYYYGGSMAFVSELNPTGSGLVYSTYLGGSTDEADGYGDQGNGIAVDSAGGAYVAGVTDATDFPTANAFQATNLSQNYANGFGTAFVSKLNATGSALIFSTYLGGSGGSQANAIALDASGAAFVTGNVYGANSPTGSTDFPLTPGAFQTTYSGGDAFVTKFNTSGTGLVYSTLLGGSGADQGNAIAVDGSGNAYVAGSSGSTNFPLQNALQGCTGNGGPYVSELNPSGSGLVFSTYLGGTGAVGNGIALDSSGNIYFTGSASSNFPTTPGALQTTYGGSGDAFLAKISLTPLPPSPSFAVAGFPSPTTAGLAHTFTVTALNADGSVNTGYAGMVHFTSSDPQAVLPANYTFTTADQGTHTFTVTLKTAGTKSITATDLATGSITGTEVGIVVQPAAAAKFVLSAPVTVKHGVAFSVTLTVYDAYGNVATGYTGTVHFSSSDSTATLPATYTFTAADAGVHTFVYVVLRRRGTQALTVTDTLNSGLTTTDSITVV